MQALPVARSEYDFCGLCSRILHKARRRREDDFISVNLQHAQSQAGLTVNGCAQQFGCIQQQPQGLSIAEAHPAEISVGFQNHFHCKCTEILPALREYAGRFD